MGEFIRSSYAKRFTRKHLGSIRKRFRSAHEWGVGIPGACEAIGHWRSTVEELIVDSKLPALVAADIDLVNMFGNCVWRAIREAIDSEWRARQGINKLAPCSPRFHCSAEW